MSGRSLACLEDHWPVWKFTGETRLTGNPDD